MALSQGQQLEDAEGVSCGLRVTASQNHYNSEGIEGDICGDYPEVMNKQDKGCS